MDEAKQIVALKRMLTIAAGMLATELRKHQLKGHPQANELTRDMVLEEIGAAVNREMEPNPEMAIDRIVAAVMENEPSAATDDVARVAARDPWWKRPELPPPAA